MKQQRNSREVKAIWSAVSRLDEEEEEEDVTWLLKIFFRRVDGDWLLHHRTRRSRTNVYREDVAHASAKYCWYEKYFPCATG
jgi:hypothetical protein